MTTKKGRWFNSVDVGNDREYKHYMKTTVIVVLVAIGFAIRYFIINNPVWTVWLFPVIMGLITISFIAHKRRKGGYKLW